MRDVNYSRLLPMAMSLPLLFSGCSATNKPEVATTSAAKHDARFFVVSTESAPFFRHGPQAGRAPDSTLSKDTMVKLIRPSFGYSKVEITATGEQGYVSSEDIRPASSNLIASFAPVKIDPLTAPSISPSTSPAAEQFKLNSDDPRLVPPPENLPNAESPSPSPEQ
jgi:hypothetical protein